MSCDLMLGRDDAAVQAFIEQYVSGFRQGLPRGKRPRYLIPWHGFIIGMQIFTRLAFARLTVLDKRLLQ